MAKEYTTMAEKKAITDKQIKKAVKKALAEHYSPNDLMQLQSYIKGLLTVDRKTSLRDS